MPSDETFLVVGFTTSAKDVIDQLNRLKSARIVWAGEGDTPDTVPEIEIANIENPSLPSSIEELTNDYSPKMIFLCPGAEQDLVNMIEGDTLERFLYKEDMRIKGVPTIVISDEHHA